MIRAVAPGCLSIASRIGSWKHNDFPDAVPEAITVDSPFVSRSKASAWWLHKSVMPRWSTIPEGSRFCGRPVRLFDAAITSRCTRRPSDPRDLMAPRNTRPRSVETAWVTITTLSHDHGTGAYSGQTTRSRSSVRTSTFSEISLNQKSRLRFICNFVAKRRQSLRCNYRNVIMRS